MGWQSWPVKSASKGDRDGMSKMYSVNSSDRLCRVYSVQSTGDTDFTKNTVAGIEGSRRDEIVTLYYVHNFVFHP